MTKAKELLFLYQQQQAQTPTYYVYDDFNRADSNTTLGNAFTGQVWTPVGSTWGISNNIAYSVSTGTTHKRAVIDSGVSDCQVQVTIPASTSGNGTRLIFRYIDTSNEWMIDETGKYRVCKRVAGVFTIVFTSLIYVKNGDILKAICNGENIKCYINDVLFYETNDTASQTATKHGFEVYTGNSTAFDNFIVSPLV